MFRKRNDPPSTAKDDTATDSYIEMSHHSQEQKEYNKSKNEPTETLKYANYQPPGYNDDQEDEELEVYIVRQKHGYMSILFSFVQTIILIIMMWQCGVAPLKLNPMIGPWPDALSEWGAKNSTLIVADGEWWRLFTPILLHAGIIHIVGNVLVQLETGVFFEKEWGSLRWLIVYFSSALASSVFSVIFKPEAISVGSSGAVMGLFGAKLTEVVLRACERTDSPQRKVAYQVRKEQCAMVTCSVTVVMLFSFVPMVDWAAHAGGVVGGMVIGVLLFSSEMELCLWKTAWAMVGLAGTVAFFVTLVTYMYETTEPIDELRDVCGYYQQYYDDYQCNCMLDEYSQYFDKGGDGR